MASIKRTATLAMLAAGFAATASHSALTWNGCNELTGTDFKIVPIATRAQDTVAEPMKMAFDLLASKSEDAKGKVDVYFTERYGKIRKFDSKTGKVITLAKLNLNIGGMVSSEGALGIALDPAFKSNNFVYIYYSHLDGTVEKSWRVSRFTLNATHDRLDLGSEVPIIKIPILGGSRHPGGAIQFDALGNLYITTGNDYTVGHDYPTYSSPNTNDLRGKILRIHPEINPVNGKYYTIPTGNLFPEGTAKTKPEIYIMGNRNPYTLSLDPVRQWVVWGDVGPDGVDMDGKSFSGGGHSTTEEYDLATKPGNYGYPFFAGDVQTKSGINASAPVVPAGSDWGFSGQGLTTLPPAIPPIYAYNRSCAITGPITRYDGDLNSTIKFPPHLTRKWLVSDFSGRDQPIQVFTLDNAGTKILSQDRIPGIALHGPLDIQYGPDGALYVINYGAQWRSSEANTGLVRIEYTGTCLPSEPKLETSTSLAYQAEHQGLAAWQGPRVEVNQAAGFSVTVATSGTFTLEIRDLMGRPVASRSAQGPSPVLFNEVRNAGVYFLHVKTEEGSRVVKVVKN